jgi:hypothetical protein
VKRELELLEAVQVLPGVKEVLRVRGVRKRLPLEVEYGEVVHAYKAKREFVNA